MTNQNEVPIELRELNKGREEDEIITSDDIRTNPKKAQAILDSQKNN